MAIIGKKINELDTTTNLTNDSVLPIVVVINSTPEDDAKKVNLSQLKDFVLEGGGGGSIPVSYYYEYPSWILSQDNKTLTVLDTTSAHAVWVFKNGIKLRQDTTSTSLDYDYFLSGTSLRFNTSLDSTDVINLEVF